jgi:hypothetical protein
MMIYHGSTEIVENPRLIKTTMGRDFGVGFYTTDIETQAVNWARRKSRQFKNKNLSPILNKYEMDDAAYEILKVLRFPEASLEWMDFVINCRSNIDYSHGYDVVVGKIADDNVGETILYVLNKVMRPEDALERLRFEKINNQICFCTEKSLGCLKFIDSEVV